MMDKILNFSESKAYKRITSIWKYFVRNIYIIVQTLVIHQRTRSRLHVLHFWSFAYRQLLETGQLTCLWG